MPSSSPCRSIHLRLPPSAPLPHPIGAGLAFPAFFWHPQYHRHLRQSCRMKNTRYRQYRNAGEFSFCRLLRVLPRVAGPYEGNSGKGAPVVKTMVYTGRGFRITLKRRPVQAFQVRQEWSAVVTGKGAQAWVEFLQGIAGNPGKRCENHNVRQRRRHVVSGRRAAPARELSSKGIM
jgi:hypothetical protein